MEIIWHGHSCFEVVENDYHVVIDPFEPGSCGTAFPPLNLEADEVLVSHEHRDHNCREAVKLRTGRKSPFTVKTFETYHDPLKGRLRGMNTVHELECDGVRVVHLGDLGVGLQPEVLEAVKGCDVLMIPTGGILTIEPEAAFYLTEKIMPRVAIPMHFKVEGHSNWRLRTRELYASAFTEIPILPLREYDSNRLTVSKDTEPHVALLKTPEWKTEVPSKIGRLSV